MYIIFEGAQKQGTQRVFAQCAQQASSPQLEHSSDHTLHSRGKILVNKAPKALLWHVVQELQFTTSKIIFHHGVRCLPLY